MYLLVFDLGKSYAQFTVCLSLELQGTLVMHKPLTLNAVLLDIGQTLEQH